MKTEKFDTIILSSTDEKMLLKQYAECFKSWPVPADEIMPNLGLFLTSKNLSRMLFFCELYKKIVQKHGVIIEFGVRWGQTLALLTGLRSIFEPFNRHRKIIGFDTFEGLKGVSKNDGELSRCKDGSYSLPPNYEEFLAKVLSIHEGLNPMAHIKRYELVKGDVSDTLPEYLKKHPETIISLAIFDFDIYEPTRAALQAIKPHLSKGSILVFDELCDDIFPGETIALKEVFGLNNVDIRRCPTASRLSYLEME